MGETAVQLKHLKKYEKDLYRCIKCGYCRDQTRFRDNVDGVCPLRITEAHPFESFEARGKVEIALAVLEGLLPINEETGKRISEIFYMCSTCRNCWDKCYVKDHIDHVGIYEAFRADLFSMGFGLPQHKRFAEWTKQNHNPYLEPHNKRLDWLPEEFNIKPMENADIVYYVGCTSSYRQKNIAKATVSILKKLGADFTILGLEEWCCGSPLFRVGAREIGEEQAKHNIEAIEKVGAKTVVFSCAGCYRTFKTDYQEIFGKLNFNLLHITEFLSQLIKEGKLKITKELKMKVTYHDPCHLVRHLAHLGKNAMVADQPREILKNIPGVELVEMDRVKLNAFCCGAGGGLRAGFTEQSLGLAAERIREAEKTGCNVLVSSCPFCYRNLTDAIKNLNSKMSMYDVTELLDRVL